MCSQSSGEGRTERRRETPVADRRCGGVGRYIFYRHFLLRAGTDERSTMPCAFAHKCPLHIEGYGQRTEDRSPNRHPYRPVTNNYLCTYSSVHVYDLCWSGRKCAISGAERSPSAAPLLRSDHRVRHDSVNGSASRPLCQPMHASNSSQARDRRIRRHGPLPAERILPSLERLRHGCGRLLLRLGDDFLCERTLVCQLLARAFEL